MEKEEVYKLIDQHYRKSFNEMVKRLTGTMGSRHNAEDVVQDTYVRACQYWSSYNPTLSFDAWISGIRTNCIHDAKKDARLRGLVKDDLMAIPDPPHPDASDRIFLRELSDKIDELAHPNGNILKLYLVHGYTSAEVSGLVEGQTAGNVRQIVSRFRQEYLPE